MISIATRSEGRNWAVSYQEAITWQTYYYHLESMQFANPSVCCVPFPIGKMGDRDTARVNWHKVAVTMCLAMLRYAAFCKFSWYTHQSHKIIKSLKGFAVLHFMLLCGRVMISFPRFGNQKRIRASWVSRRQGFTMILLLQHEYTYLHACMIMHACIHTYYLLTYLHLECHQS